VESGLKIYSHAKNANETLTVCGLSSVLAITKTAPETIERLFFDEDHAPLFADTCRILAEKRKIYRLVTHAELQKIADTKHTQGVAVVIQKPAPLPLENLSENTLCLHSLQNPHNIGAILRTAAFFGLEKILLSHESYTCAMAQSAWRVAKGGFSYVKLLVYKNEDELFAWTNEKKYRILAAVKPDGKTQRTLREFSRDKNTNPLIITLGNEETGLSPTFINRAHGRFSIHGSGKVESLNVSVAAAVCLRELLPRI